MRSSSARSSSGRQGGGGAAPGCGGCSGGWQARHSALALPKFASGWICRPCPGYHWKTTGSPSNVTRPPPSPAAPVHGLRAGWGAFGNERVGQNSALRWSWRNAAGIRVDVSSRRRASDSTPATTARSSPTAAAAHPARGRPRAAVGREPRVVLLAGDRSRSLDAGERAADGWAGGARRGGWRTAPPWRAAAWPSCRAGARGRRGGSRCRRRPRAPARRALAVRSARPSSTSRTRRQHAARVRRAVGGWLGRVPSSADPRPAVSRHCVSPPACAAAPGRASAPAPARPTPPPAGGTPATAGPRR